MAGRKQKVIVKKILTVANMASTVCEKITIIRQFHLASNLVLDEQKN